MVLERVVEREAVRRKSDAVVYLAGEILMSSNLKLFAAALAYASGLALTNGMGSMRQWAAKNALTVAAVSKVATRLRRDLNLPAGAHLRDDRVADICREAQSKKHWRRAKWMAGAAGETGEVSGANLGSNVGGVDGCGDTENEGK